MYLKEYMSFTMVNTIIKQVNIIKEVLNNLEVFNFNIKFITLKVTILKVIKYIKIICLDH